MMRLGHYRPVHVKSRASQLLRTRIECSLQPDPREPGYCRQEVDIRDALATPAADTAGA
jgi:hypothetical protein